MELFDNISYQGKKPNFVRDQFKTLQEMRSFPETSVDEGHVSFCLETGKRYTYSALNEYDSILGKWRLTVDTALDTSSENPVQNKLIAENFKVTEERIQELDTKIDTNLSELESKLDKELSDLNDKVDKNITDFEQSFNKKFNDLNKKVDTELAILNQRITDEIDNLDKTIERLVNDKVEEKMSKVIYEFDIKFEQLRVDLIQLIEDLFETYEPGEETIEKLWLDTQQLETQLGIDGDLMPEYPEAFDSLTKLKDRLKILHNVYDIEELVSIKDIDPPITIEKVRDMITSIQITTDLI